MKTNQEDKGIQLKSYPRELIEINLNKLMTIS